MIMGVRIKSFQCSCNLALTPVLLLYNYNSIESAQPIAKHWKDFR